MGRKDLGRTQEQVLKSAYSPLVDTPESSTHPYSKGFTFVGLVRRETLEMFRCQLVQAHLLRKLFEKSLRVSGLGLLWRNMPLSRLRAQDSPWCLVGNGGMGYGVCYWGL